MVHGTSHHLGMDVHDCAQARRDLHLDGAENPSAAIPRTGDDDDEAWLARG